MGSGRDLRGLWTGTTQKEERKCQVLANKRREHIDIKFLDGTPVPKVTEAEYLGGILHHKADFKAELVKRIGVAGICRFQFGNFWRRAAISKKKKMRMHKAIVSAKLTYALEIATLTQAQKNKLDATFYKGLREIMGVKATYAQMIAGEAPTNTNESLLEEANKELTKLTEEVEEEQEEPTTGQTRTSKTKKMKE